MPPEPDGDLSRLHLNLQGIPPWGVAVMGVMLMCVGGPLFQLWLFWIFYRITASPWGRHWTARWWSRALPPLAFATFLAAILTGMPYLLVPTVLLLVLVPVALWRFLCGMTRPGSDLHRAIRWPGVLMSALLSVGTVMGGGLLLLGDLTSGNLMGVALLLLTGAPLLLLLPLGQLPRLWQRTAGQPTAHIDALEARLRPLGQITHRTDRRLAMRLGDITIEADFAIAPAQILLTVPLPDLPDGLSVRARRPDDPPGVSLGDPMLGELLLVTAQQPEAARRLLSGLHEELLGCLHAWPDSTLADGVLRVVLLGPPFHPPGRIRPETPPDARDTVAVLSEQLDSVRRLTDALQRRRASSARPVQRPISERLPQ